MAHLSVGRGGFADAALASLGRNGRLERIAALIDWAPLEAVVAEIHAAPSGRPAYPPSVMVRALVLQQMYGLSDPGLEEALSDRLSFRRFAGLSAEDPTPDHSTISRFRAQLAARGLGALLVAMLDRQLVARGFVLKQGTLIDASLIEAAVRPPPPMTPSADAAETASDHADGKPPEKPSKLVRSALDPHAGWTRRGNVRVFGYKAHVAVDQGSGFVRRTAFTGAEVNDTLMADGLVIGDERAVYADAAYDSHARRARLEGAGVKCRIQRRGNKHHALTARQKLYNRLVGRRRCAVERCFALLKGAYRWTRVAYRGIARNALKLDLAALAMNMARLERIAV
jgi:IS5 family transposase